MNKIEGIQFESLEQRRHLSSTLLGGQLFVKGTAGDDELSVRLKAGGGLLQVNDNGHLRAFVAAAVSRISVIGYDGDDVITIDAGIKVPTSLNGGDGNDTIRGGGGRDMVIGSNGDDVEFGGKGADILDGADGDDRIDAGVDSDQDDLTGDAGADTFTDVGPEDKTNKIDSEDTVTANITPTLKNVALADGLLTVNEGGGNDGVFVALWNSDPSKIIVRSNGFDRLFDAADVNGIFIRGGDGNDRIEIDANLTIDATIYGGAGNDSLFGGAGADLLVGHDGDDDLSGRDNDDSLSGGAGNNVVSGGADVDWLDNGHGQFVPDGEALPAVQAIHATIDGVSYYLNQYAGRSELWRNDGTAAGTIRLAVLAKDLANQSILAVGSRAVFFSNGKLWSTDGTVDGTITIPGPGGGAWFAMANPFESFESLNGKKTFIANGGLYSTDGTVNGTILLAIDVAPKTGFQAVGDKWYTQVINLESQQVDYYVTDGTVDGTQKLASMSQSGIADFPGPATFNGDLLFSIRDGNQTKVYGTDGTTADTHVIAQFGVSTDVSQYLVVGDSLFFIGKVKTGTLNGVNTYSNTLYKSDGTPLGTVAFQDLGASIDQAGPVSGVYRIELSEAVDGKILVAKFSQTYRANIRPNFVYDISTGEIDPQP